MPSFIYALLTDDVVFYVGQTGIGPQEPEGYLKRGHRGNWKRLLHRRLAEYRHQSRSLSWTILEEVDIDGLDSAEMFWISSLRAAGAELVNRTDGGGKNTRGMKLSSEAKAKLRSAAEEQYKDPQNRIRAGQKNRGRAPWNKGLKESRPDVIARISAAKAGAANTDEQKAKISEKLTGRRLSPEHRQRLRDAALRRYGRT